MEDIIGTVVNFMRGVRFSDLPNYVIHEMKRVILDSIGCAVGGLLTERGRIATELAVKLGGPSESSIIGTHNKVSCANAAFANGELINALDYDAIARVTGHATPSLIATVLALGERSGISGRDLILAAALGFEISARLGSAAALSSCSLGPGDKMQWPRVSGNSVVTLAVAAAASKVLDLDKQKMANAIGLAGCICPPNLDGRFRRAVPMRMTKYGSSGWVAQAGITSALLAELGYIGDTEIFDPEHCFWTYTGQREYQAEHLLDELGTEWKCHKIWYKQYPCGG